MSGSQLTFLDELDLTVPRRSPGLNSQRVANQAQYLKQVSRVKHQVLAYIRTWGTVIGSRHSRLAVVDCFAGRGAFVDENGKDRPGSPKIALDIASELVTKRPGLSFRLAFGEKDHETAECLRRALVSSATAAAVQWTIHEELAANFVQQIIDSVRSGGTGSRIIPTFFFIDPYGHPISVPVMRELLALGKTELLVNLMWFRLNMHLSNPSEQRALDRLFGHTNWRAQPFVAMRGPERERAFLDYFVGQVGAQYNVRLAMPFSPEDAVPGGDRRSKFYLIHFSSHPLAARLMKSVMKHATEELQEIATRGRGGSEQLELISRPDPGLTLRELLCERYRGRTVTFEQILIDDLNDLSYGEKAYRAAIRNLEGDHTVTIQRVTSRLLGIDGRDRITFLR